MGSHASLGTGHLRPAVPSVTGHVVAVRVTSEDANDGFKPTCGSIDELSFRTSPDVWGYFSVKSGGGIHEFSDSQVREKWVHVICCLSPPASLRSLQLSLGPAGWPCMVRHTMAMFIP